MLGREGRGGRKAHVVAICPFRPKPFRKGGAERGGGRGIRQNNESL